MQSAKQIDFFNTHDHADHNNLKNKLQEKFGVRGINCKYDTFNKSDNLKIGKYSINRFKVDVPGTKNKNDQGYACYIRSKRTGYLFTGDVTALGMKSIEKSIINRSRSLKNLYVLVPHHGSNVAKSRSPIEDHSNGMKNLAIALYRKNRNLKINTIVSAS